MKSLSTGVFERTGYDAISERAFYTVLALAIVWGLAGTAIAAHQAIMLGYTPTVWGLIGLGLIVPIIGIIVATTSNKWPISFLGYNLIVIPFGIVLAPAVREYSPTVVRDVCAQTAVVTGIMGFAGMSFPSVFRKLGGFLFVALTGLVIVNITQLFVPSWRDMTWVHYVAVVIFSLYIGYDFFRASEVPRTVDNAIDIAVSIYLDILNIFVRLLALSKKD